MTRRLLILALALGGCEHAVETDDAAVEAPPALGAKFNATETGTVAGQVHWVGAAPMCPPISTPMFAEGKPTYRQFPNPNAPRADAIRHVVNGAVVFLEGVDAERSRPWDRDPVRVEITTERIHVRAGEHIGFVHIGDEVEFESLDSPLHVLSARGAAFFALPFPDASRPLRRRFNQPGLVELTSGAGRYWHRAYLWVAEHPYFVRTDEGGCFKLPQVPAGEYTLVAWLPNPELAAVDRDPNTGMVLRHHYAEPMRVEKSVRVQAGSTSQVDFWFLK